jgi:hypothetical protein
MPGGDRRVYMLTDLFTRDELNRVMKLFLECRNTKENFKERCTKEVVEPVLSRVNADAGYNASPSSLVYRLEMYLRAVRGEAWVTHRRNRRSSEVGTTNQEVELCISVASL